MYTAVCSVLAVYGQPTLHGTEGTLHFGLGIQFYDTRARVYWVNTSRNLSMWSTISLFSNIHGLNYLSRE